ncbi:hypothetical protein [Priestia filamentosa]|uniref:DUF6199 domain-containing protein n=1 Tax=Priestia filamentosa TaxID=1402861 RepID=A0A0H4KFX1_9BACI|nr:hypothetical protein [Priestia filamentosa]AKO92505.1 hypothetical protein BEH_10640 [Priestia filamentosa]MDT3762574.1 hypothetical protein [Priestia filamentosa]WCM17635.1 hypothetical protein PGN40_09860 [Priestia filamentosa]WRU97038.1 hypothetical protein RYX51_08185 [Priestia filamentosa]
MDRLAGVILSFIFFIPVYVVLIWSYFDPEESLLLGRRWVYQEDPEPSPAAIRYIKVMSLIGIVGLTFVFIFLFIKFI